MLIALGREPDEMETTIIPTPTPSLLRLDKVFEPDNPMHIVLSPPQIFAIDGSILKTLSG